MKLFILSHATQVSNTHQSSSDLSISNEENHPCKVIKSFQKHSIFNQTAIQVKMRYTCQKEKKTIPLMHKNFARGL
jgi:hypothetical protein